MIGWIDKIVDCLTPPPPHQQNVNLESGWIDKTVDCRSGMDQCQLPTPPHPQINNLQIWSGLTKLLIADLGWIDVDCLPSLPPRATQNSSRKLKTNHASATLYSLIR